ncbi:MAG: hypothetical protein ACI9RZ_002443, partial [Sphingobacteriales bacterium]
MFIYFGYLFHHFISGCDSRTNYNLNIQYQYPHVIAPVAAA